MPSLKPPEDESIRTLYVGGIYARVVEQDIRDHFYAYGELESVIMAPQRAAAYVTFTTRRGAEKAAKELADNLEIKGLQLKLMWGQVKTPRASNEERQQSVARSDLLPKAVTSQQIIQPPRSAASREQPPPPLVRYVNVPLPSSPQLGRPFYAPVDLRRTGAVIPPQDESAALIRPGIDPDNSVGPDGNTAKRTEELPRNASEGGSEGLRKQSEPRTMPSGKLSSPRDERGAKRSSDPLKGMSPQEMRERMMKRKKGSSTSTSTPVGSTVVPPVLPPGLAATTLGVDVAAQVRSSAAVGESSEETPLTRFVTSFPRDFLAEKSGVTTLWPDADTLLFPAPMQLLEKKSDVELVNKATELSLQGVQVALMARRRLLAQVGQQDVWRARLAEAEAAEARMSSQLREAASEIQSLKEAAAAAEARAAAAVEARKARDALLMTADAQLREMREKLRQKSEETQEEREDALTSAALRARAKLMREFLDGKSSSWDPQAEIDFYVAHIGEEADLVSNDTLP